MNPDPRRILLLEDEPPVARVAERMLARSGYAVSVLFDGAEGLQAALSGNYDLCLLNVVLPGIDGYAIAERLHAEGTDLPLIFFTARPEHEVRARILAIGIKAAYVQKPCSTSGLVEMVGEVLGGSGWL